MMLGESKNITITVHLTTTTIITITMITLSNKFKYIFNILKFKSYTRSYFNYF
jgi:hypothetical protein